MRIDRIRVKNFRNLADVDICLQPGTVVVGENRAGKSNLMHAMRLVLDPRLSQSDRRLTRDDFWDGLSDGTADWDPMRGGQVIEISLEFSGFEEEPATLVALSDALLEGEPMRARLTFRFGPKIGAPFGDPTAYRASIYGRDDPENVVPVELRSYLHLAFLPALRDAESDIAGWRRSPLRELLEAAASAVPKEDLTRIAEDIKQANDEIGDLEALRQLGASISDRTTAMVGDSHGLDTQLGITPLDPLRLIRTMKLFVDGDTRRPLSSASLGTLNVLYLTLLELGLDSRLVDSGIAHVLYVIEEPEAHLHPHLQRLIYRRILSRGSMAQTTIVTTQSPHIASVTPPRNLVVLRTVDNTTVAHAAATATLDDSEWNDIARYLDVTRAEIVFGRRVLLVEGFSEQVVVPEIYRARGLDLDKSGITVCAIHGTHFGSYARFCESLGIPWAVLTDGDVDDDGASDGKKRADRLLTTLGRDGAHDANGIFVGATTFEHDLFQASTENARKMVSVLTEMSSAMRATELATWVEAPPTEHRLVEVIAQAGGKGRFAQRISTLSLDPPTYLTEAVDYLESM